MGKSAGLTGPGPGGKRKAELGTESTEDSGKSYCVEQCMEYLGQAKRKYKEGRKMEKQP